MFLFSLFLPLIVAQKCNTDVLCKKEHMCNFDHDTSVRFNLSVRFFSTQFQLIQIKRNLRKMPDSLSSGKLYWGFRIQ